MAEMYWGIMGPHSVLAQLNIVLAQARSKKNNLQRHNTCCSYSFFLCETNAQHLCKCNIKNDIFYILFLELKKY